MKHLSLQLLIQFLILLAIVVALWPVLVRASAGAFSFATYNYTGGWPGGTNAGMVPTPNLFGVVEIKLDFAAIAAARTAAGQAALASTDVLQVLPVLANTWVQMVSVEVTTAEGATATADIGDGTATAGYISGANLNALGHTGSLATSSLSVAVGGGKIYTVDDTIDVLLNNNAIDVAVMRLRAVMVDLRKYRQ